MDRCRSTYRSTTHAKVSLKTNLIRNDLSLYRYSEGEIHFSLMAVVSELRRKYERELEQVLAGKSSSFRRESIL